jgi:hypothetical protein
VPQQPPDLLVRVTYASSQPMWRNGWWPASAPQVNNYGRPRRRNNARERRGGCRFDGRPIDEDTTHPTGDDTTTRSTR